MFFELKLFTLTPLNVFSYLVSFFAQVQNVAIPGLSLFLPVIHIPTKIAVTIAVKGDVNF